MNCHAFTRTGRALLTALPVTLVLLALSPAANAVAPLPWSWTGQMDLGRSLHTATPLLDGGVLATGGVAPSGTATAERYDPTTGEWSPTGAMDIPRYFHQATRLNDGTVLVTGGVSGSFTTASVERYDPLTGTWSPAAAMGSSRITHGATLLADGRVLVVGGSDSFSSTIGAEIYDPTTNTWSPAAAPAEQRGEAVTTLLPDGSVLLVGGYTPASGNGLLSAERYLPETDTWVPADSLASPRSTAASTRLSDGDLLVVGGYTGNAATATAERYDVESGTWSSAGAMAFTRGTARATTLPNGMVLVTGGAFDTTTAELYDSRTGAWSQAGSMQVVRERHTATLLENGKVLLAGGTSGGGDPIARSELFSPITSVDAPPIEFGDEYVGFTATATVPVQNTGHTALFVASATLEGAAAADFAISFDRCSSQGAIPPGQTCLIGLRFKPQAIGERKATLMLQDNSVSASDIIELSGVGVAPPTAVAADKPGDQPTDKPDSADEADKPKAKPPVLRCERPSAKRLICSGLPSKLGDRGKVKLFRAGKLYATGRIRGGQLRLKVVARVTARRYQLRVGAPGGTLLVRVSSIR